MERFSAAGSKPENPACGLVVIKECERLDQRVIIIDNAVKTVALTYVCSCVAREGHTF